VLIGKRGLDAVCMTHLYSRSNPLSHGRFRIISAGFLRVVGALLTVVVRRSALVMENHPWLGTRVTNDSGGVVGGRCGPEEMVR